MTAGIIETVAAIDPKSNKFSDALAGSSETQKTRNTEQMELLNKLPPAPLLALGIMAEIAATLSLKLADGFSKPKFLIVTGLGYGISFLMLSLVLRQWAVGPVYGIWAGCGVAGVALAGTVLFHETIGVRELIGFAAIIGGVALLSAHQ